MQNPIIPPPLVDIVYIFVGVIDFGIIKLIAYSVAGINSTLIYSLLGLYLQIRKAYLCSQHILV